VGQLLQVTRAEGSPSSLRRSVQLDQLVQQMVDGSLIEAAAHGCQVKFENREPVRVEAELLSPRTVRSLVTGLEMRLKDHMFCNCLL
jgi:hypothetical protein